MSSVKQNSGSEAGELDFDQNCCLGAGTSLWAWRTPLGRLQVFIGAV